MRRPAGPPPPKSSLGRWDPKTRGAAPPPRSALPPKVDGEHRWVSLRWNALTLTQAQAVQRGARIEPRAESLVALTVGCFDCHAGYAVAADTPCPGAAEPPPAPLEPAPDAVPVEAPTSPDAGPPVVELARPMSETALTL